MTDFLKISGLLVERDRLPALTLDHLTIKEAEILAVTGANGCGKTTLLLTMARLLPFQKGKILLRGQPLEEQDSLSHRRRIGLVFQDPLLLDMSVEENITLGLRFRHMPRAETARRVDEWLEYLNIGHLRKRPARKLSGGEAQRVNLARVLALRPELLLLDEPFRSLDAATRSRLLNDLKSILEQMHTTTLFVTHDPAEARAFGHRIVVLAQGRVESQPR